MHFSIQISRTIPAYSGYINPSKYCMNRHSIVFLSIPACAVYFSYCGKNSDLNFPLSTPQPFNSIHCPLPSNTMFQPFSPAKCQTLPTPTKTSLQVSLLHPPNADLCLTPYRHFHSCSTFSSSYQLSRPHSSPLRFSLKTVFFHLLLCVFLS